MSGRKTPAADDPLARLTAIEAPEFLDRLVLERALPLLQAHTVVAPARTERSAAPAPAVALFGRWASPRLKSS